jgi:hypothetical protein
VDQDNWFVDLPKTVAAWEEGRREDIESALDDDLSGQVSDFLDDACQSGGWPEDEQVEVGEIKITRNRLTADVTVYFNEIIPSSCKDISNHEDREARLVITLMRGEANARVERSAADPNQWDLQDRNSAADGT